MDERQFHGDRDAGISIYCEVNSIISLKRTSKHVLKGAFVVVFAGFWRPSLVFLIFPSLGAWAGSLGMWGIVGNDWFLLSLSLFFLGYIVKDKDGEEKERKEEQQEAGGRSPSLSCKSAPTT